MVWDADASSHPGHYPISGTGVARGVCLPGRNGSPTAGASTHSSTLNVTMTDTCSYPYSIHLLWPCLPRLQTHLLHVLVLVLNFQVGWASTHVRLRMLTTARRGRREPGDCMHACMHAANALACPQSS